jgi:hypothetical protein
VTVAFEECSVSEQKPNPTMTAEDMGAALAAFAVCLANAFEANPHREAGAVLRSLTRELAIFQDDMKQSGGSTPAAQAIFLATGYLALAGHDGRSEPEQG